MLFLLGVPLILGASTIAWPTVVAAMVSAIVAAGGVFGYQAKKKDDAAKIWKDIAEAREAENRLQAHTMAVLEARVDLLTSEWAREAVRQIIQLIERERIEGRM